jgi:hypothetical protein
MEGKAMSDDELRKAIFSRRPDPTHVSVRYDIVRTPPKGSIKGIILARELTGATTHYWHGRTLPCSGPNCPACQENTPARWYGYVPLMSKATNRIVIFELTSSATPAVDTFLGTYKTLRGARLEAFRIPQRSNGRVVIELQPPADPDEDLPNSPDIEGPLLAMWEASWARSSLNLRPGAENATADQILETVEKATEHKKQYQHTPRVAQAAPIGELLAHSALKKTPPTTPRPTTTDVEPSDNDRAH